MKLHTKLGKPIPPPDPKAATAIAALNAQEEAAKSKTTVSVSSGVAVAPAAAPVVKSSLAPRITFVAGELVRFLKDENDYCGVSLSHG